MARDYYEALGVPRTADADQLQEATGGWPAATTPT